MRRLPLWGTVAGGVVGVGLAVGLVAGGLLAVPAHLGDTDASEPFLAAWARARRGTYVVDGDFRRTLRDGRTIYSAFQVVQRPPDRIVRQFGGITGTRDGHELVCSTDARGTFNCFEGTGPARDAEEELREELDTFRSYFGPMPLRFEDPSGGTVAPPAGTVPAPPGLYRVREGDAGCFELFLQINYPDPEYGTHATFCFDGPTGALRLLERESSNGTIERSEARSITTVVTPADLEVTPDARFDTRMDLPPPSAPLVQDLPGSTVPTQVPSADELTRMPLRALVAGAQAAADAGGDITPYVREVTARMTAGGLSINDDIWLAPDGRPTKLGQEVVRELLRIGYMAPIG